MERKIYLVEVNSEPKDDDKIIFLSFLGGNVQIRKKRELPMEYKNAPVIISELQTEDYGESIEALQEMVSSYERTECEKYKVNIDNLQSAISILKSITEAGKQ